MGNKKGFTLVELLAVIVLLILLVLTAFPSFGGLSSTAKNKYDNTVNILLKNAASMYIYNEENKLDEVERTLGNSTSTEYCIPIGILIKKEYLDTDIGDSKGTEIKDEYCVIVKKKSLDPVEYEYVPPFGENPKTAADFGINNY